MSYVTKMKECKGKKEICPFLLLKGPGILINLCKKKFSPLDRTQMSKEQSRESCDAPAALGGVLRVMGHRTGLELLWLQ